MSNTEPTVGLEKLMNQRFDGIDTTLDRIEQHAIRTNGRVTKNETFRIKIESQIVLWQWIAGFVGISGIANVILLFANLK